MRTKIDNFCFDDDTFVTGRNCILISDLEITPPYKYDHYDFLCGRVEPKLYSKFSKPTTKGLT